MHSLHSIADVCDIEMISASTALPKSPRTVLIEVPHGATRSKHFEATRRRLVDDYPDYLEQFFFVNTDIGSIECARWISRMITNPSAYPELGSCEDAIGGRDSGVDRVLIVRGLVPRTFIDLNRVIHPASGSYESPSKGEHHPTNSPRSDNPPNPHHAHHPNHPMTPGLPAYVTHPKDVDTLQRMHGDYQDIAGRAYDLALGSAGPSLASALILHTYAPRTVPIDRLDGSTLAALRRAYEPDVFATLARRPDVDLITETTVGSRLAPEALAGLICEHYSHIGIEARENATYRLHESTLGYIRSTNYPGRVLCLEINRALLADPFTPFEEMSIRDSKARHIAAPIAAGFLAKAVG